MEITDYFSLFELQPNFEIDEVQLTKTFRSLQRATHPDNYAGRSDFELRTAVMHAATINEAYHVLRDPLRRARYLLELQGVETSEDKNSLMDADFLLEQIELRERIAEIRTASNPVAAVREIKDLLQARRSQLITGLAADFHTASPNSLQSAADRVRRLKFFERLEKDVHYLDEQYLDLDIAQ